jgi:hypothetical protein
MRAAWFVLLAAGTAVADPGPSLDDFYERTRERDEGFTNGRLAKLIVGAQTANPSDDALAPHLASGIRIGGDFGIRRISDIARSQVSLDILRTHETGTWFTDLAWHTTAFRRQAHDDAEAGYHLSFDSVLARRTELQVADLAELVERPYTLADVEAEVAPIGPRVDKDGFFAIPIGVANRLRWTDGERLERRTSVSVAAAVRGFPKDIRHHAQFDLLRLKRTSWGLSDATAWTVSAGYQRLPQGIDTLPIWALVGYEWAGDRNGAVWQVGGAYRDERIDVGADYARHFELAPGAAMFERVDSASVHVRHRIGALRYGVAFENVSIHDRGSLRALTPELAVRFLGVELGLRYRAAWTRDVMFPADRFRVALDWLL